MKWLLPIMLIASLAYAAKDTPVGISDVTGARTSPSVVYQGDVLSDVWYLTDAQSLRGGFISEFSYTIFAYLETSDTIVAYMQFGQVIDDTTYWSNQGLSIYSESTDSVFVVPSIWQTITDSLGISDAVFTFSPPVYDSIRMMFSVGDTGYVTVTGQGAHR